MGTYVWARRLLAPTPHADLHNCTLQKEARDRHIYTSTESIPCDILFRQHYMFSRRRLFLRSQKYQRQVARRRTMTPSPLLSFCSASSLGLKGAGTLFSDFHQELTGYAIAGPKKDNPRFFSGSTRSLCSACIYVC